MKRRVIDAHLERLVKDAFKARKKVCGFEAWAGFAAEVRRLTLDSADGADQFLRRALLDVEAALQPAN